MRERKRREGKGRERKNTEGKVREKERRGGEGRGRKDYHFPHRKKNRMPSLLLTNHCIIMKITLYKKARGKKKGYEFFAIELVKRINKYK